jgi:serine/threonine protein kinase
MEYIPRGNIYSLIPKHGKKKQSNQLIASIIKDVAKSVYFLHKMNPPIIHRDIKPENVLMDDNYNIKLTDFGWSNYLNNEEKRSTVCGTPIYLAPEMINRKGHDERVDIWCIGVLLFELSTGRVPFQGNNIDVLKYNIRNMKISWPSDIDREAKDLISKILKYNPNDRLTVEEILRHPFIEKYFPDAVNELIIPDNDLKYKTFVVSVDDPKYWDPIKKEKPDSSRNKNSSLNYKKCNTTNEYYRNDKDCLQNKYNKKQAFYNEGYCYDNYYSEKYDKYKTNDFIDKRENDKYDNLLKKYENLQKEFKLTKKNNENIIDKLKRELNDKKIKISKLMTEERKNNYSESDYRRKSKEIEELELIYEDLKTENFELKERINHYRRYMKEKQKLYFDNNLNEIRDSIKTKNNINFKEAMDKLRVNLDEETQKNFYEIIKLKEKQLNQYKEEDKFRREKEKKNFTFLINKYDKSLSFQENENKNLKNKLKELESYFL